MYNIVIKCSITVYKVVYYTLYTHYTQMCHKWLRSIHYICDPLRRNHPSALFHDIQFVTSSASVTLADHGDIFRLAIGLTFAKLQRPECNTCN